MPRLVEGHFPRDSHLTSEWQIIIIIIIKFSSLQRLGLPTD
jgi:hypothetical protein